MTVIPFPTRKPRSLRRWLALADRIYGDSIENIAAAVGAISLGGLLILAAAECIAAGIL